jgi:hypothetical protein
MRLACAQGLVIGALLLTKLHAAAAAAAAFGVVAAWCTPRRGLREAGRHVASAAAVAAIVGLWWYVRAYVLYGSPTGMVGDFRTAQFAGKRQNILTWLSQWRLTHDSFWGVWGWLEVPLPGAYYAVLSTLGVVSVVPLAGGLARRRAFPEQGIASSVYWVALVGAYAAIMVAVAALIGPVHNNQGRHWLPLVGAVALLLGVSGQMIGERRRTVAYTLLGAWCIALTAANVRLIRAMGLFYGS